MSTEQAEGLGGPGVRPRGSMSADFDKLLREARRALPLPDELVTQRARSRALAAVRRRRLRRPVAVLLAAALVALGVGIGALVTPSGSAAPAPSGLGFLPATGWSVLQNGGDGTPVRPAVAIAANVPLSPDDDADGLPLSTLETLPPDGVVIVTSFIARGRALLRPVLPEGEAPAQGGGPRAAASSTASSCGPSGRSASTS